MTQLWDCTPFDLSRHIPQAFLLTESMIFSGDYRANLQRAADSGAEMVIPDVELKQDKNGQERRWDDPAVYWHVFGCLQILRRIAHEPLICIYPGWAKMGLLPIEIAAECDLIGLPAYFALSTTTRVWDRLVSKRLALAEKFGLPIASFVCHRRAGRGQWVDGVNRPAEERLANPLLTVEEWRHVLTGTTEMPHTVWWCWQDEPRSEPHIAEFGVAGG